MSNVYVICYDYAHMHDFRLIFEAQITAVVLTFQGVEPLKVSFCHSAAATSI